MKKPLTLAPQLLKQLIDLPNAERALALSALLDLVAHFGKPHSHAGIGIRKLHPNVFECRAGLRLRFVFHDKPEALVVRFIGNHDEVRKFVGTLR